MVLATHEPPYYTKYPTFSSTIEFSSKSKTAFLNVLMVMKNMLANLVTQERNIRTTKNQPPQQKSPELYKGLEQKHLVEQPDDPDDTPPQRGKELQ